MSRIAFLGTLAIAASCGSQQAAAPSSRSAADDQPAVRSDLRADLVLVGGIVRTLDPSTPEATAIAIKDGRIAAVGSDQEIEPWIAESTKVIGLEGRSVVPGLVDSHLHLFGIGARNATLNLVGTRSVKEIRDLVNKAAREGSGWIVGRGWDQNDWEGPGAKVFPKAQDLDAVSGERPVLLTRVDGHAVWVNSAAMRAAGIGPKTADPPGGKIVRVAGKPSGVFVDNAIPLVEAFVPAPSRGDLIKWALIGERECLKNGLVQVHDMGLGAAEIEVLKALDAQGDLKLRIYGMLDGGVEDLDALMGAGPIVPSDRKHRVTIRGIKFYMDGALGSRGAALLAHYADDAKNSGLILTEPSLFEARVDTAKKRGFQVSTHAIGDRANRMVLDVYERVYGRDTATSRPRVEHAQVISGEDLPRFASLGVIASMQPTHATSDMPWAEARVGPERIRGAYAWRTLLTSGATIASGSDAPVEDVSPFGGLYAATTRQDPLGFPPESWRPEEKMSPEQALRSFTTSGAYASFREAEAGKIKVGFVADLTVLSDDPIAAASPKLLEAKAELTIIDGEIAYARPGADRRPAPKKPAPMDASIDPAPDTGRSPDPMIKTSSVSTPDAGL